MVEFFGKDIEPGSHEYLKLKVVTMLDGNDLYIPLHIIQGEEPGPVMGLFAAIHGSEYYQNRIIRRMVVDTKPDTIKGTILAVPVANPPAFSHTTRQTPNPPEETVDFANLNRVFPGTRETPLFGSLEPTDVSLTMRIAQTLTKVALKCTHILDFHGQMAGMALKKMLFNLDPTSKEMARIFGLGILHDPPPPTGAGRKSMIPMTAYAEQHGIYGLVPEIGGGLHSEYFEGECERLGVQGTRNVMAHLGMIDDEIVLPEKQFYFVKAPHVRATVGGYFVTDMGPGDVGIGKEPREVSKGEVLGTVYNPYSLKEMEQIKAPADGLIYACRVSGLVEAQSEVLAVADYDGSKWIE